MIAALLTGAAAFAWCCVLLLPWQPWRARPSLDAATDTDGKHSLNDVTVLIPARNEAGVIGTTLQCLAEQGNGLRVILVDDQSTDGTARIAVDSACDLRVIPGRPLPEGWTGKLWALEQGRHHIATPLTLLLDADIRLRPGTVAALRAHMRTHGYHFVSLMAMPHMSGFWERLLLPAFVYFFQLVYPFRLSNAPSTRVAAAAGGCVLLETRLLGAIGGFGALRGELIDDCALARRVKARGGRTWIGLTHSALSGRRSARLADIWNMVARTAFTQLRYSPVLLALCTALMVLGFWVPLFGLTHPDALVRYPAIGALAAMMLSYRPTLRYYGRSAAWALAMPLIGTLYLAMTWTSALRYWRGERARWKDRSYASTG